MEKNQKNKTRKLRTTKLRARFISVLILTSLAPLALAGIFAYFSLQNTLRQDAERFGSQIAATAAAEVNSFIVSQLKILDTIATIYNPEFPTDPEITAQIVEHTLFKNASFSDISIIDGQGNEIVRENKLQIIAQEDLKNVGNTEDFRAVKNTGIYISPTYIEGGKPFFDLGRWIADSQGNFLGAVFTQIDAKIMAEVARNISEITGEGGRVYMVNDRGIVIAHPDLSYMLGERNLSNLPAVTQIIRGRPSGDVSYIYENEIGEQVLGSAEPIDITFTELDRSQTFPINWFVVTEQSSSLVFADIERALTLAILVILLVMFSAAAAAVILARRISKPVEALHKAAAEYGRGNLSYRPEIVSNDEIGALAESFTSMASTVSRYVNDVKRSEEVTIAERNKLSIILSGITDAVIAVDLKRKIILFNRAAEILSGLEASDVIGKPLQTAVTLYRGNKKLPVKEYAPIRPGKPKAVMFSGDNLKFVNSKGNELYVKAVSGSIREGESIGLGCIITLHDRTRETYMEKVKGEFVSIAAHQLRTPVTGMKWAFQGLLENEYGPLTSQQQKVIETGLASSQHMAKLIGDLLNVARIEEGRFGLNMNPGSLSGLLAGVVDGHQNEAKDKGVKLVLDVPAKLPTMNFDDEKMEMALENIVGNAVRYTPPKGKVNIKARADRGWIKIEVADTGIGIPKSQMDRIFNKFFRAENALRYQTSGSGLGLYISKNIIESHGGEISIQSVEKQGTTVAVRLPIK